MNNQEINKKITQAERELYFWQMNSDADNYTARLFQLIMKADRINIEKLRLSYPKEVEVALRYRDEAGYWEDLQNRINGVVVSDDI